MHRGPIRGGISYRIEYMNKTLRTPYTYSTVT